MILSIERVCATQTENESLSSFRKLLLFFFLIFRKIEACDAFTWIWSLKWTGNIITINWTTKRSANLLKRDVCLIDIYYNYSSIEYRHLTNFCVHWHIRWHLRHEIDVYYFIYYYISLPPLNHWIIEFYRDSISSNFISHGISSYLKELFEMIQKQDFFFTSFVWSNSEIVLFTTFLWHLICLCSIKIVFS